VFDGIGYWKLDGGLLSVGAEDCNMDDPVVLEDDVTTRDLWLLGTLVREALLSASNLNSANELDRNYTFLNRQR
jgi:hypothetical protein